MSFAYYDIMLSPYYHKQLLDLFHLEYIKKCSSFLLYYEDYFTEHHFSLFKDIHLLKASIHPHIALLCQYDNENHTNYRDTLDAYLENNRNSTATAAKLC